MKKAKSFREKLARSDGLPKIEEIAGRMSRKWGSGTMVIPAPLEVDHLMKAVPAGKVTTVAQLREALARKHGATIGCPLTTGIFAWVSACAAEEAALEGERDITPYWRTLKAGGELNEKYPGGIAAQAARLQAEGHVIEPGKGRKPPRVKDFESSLAEL